MTPRRNRLMSVVVLLVGVSLAAVFGLRGCEDLKFYFFDPSQVAAGEVEINKSFRLGGMVKDGTFVRVPESLDVSFVVTDFAHDVTVRYSGLLPDLFREGQGVVATGKLNQDGDFVAENILAKHDENYMPPEVAESLKKNPAEQGY
ncbi:MAG: cytochrome c maturation protein CcmE [Gammaproteobacteria bacterium]